MNKKKFINFRQPSDLTDMEIDEIIKESGMKTIGEFMMSAEYDVWQRLIETGEIFDEPVKDRFWGLDDEATVRLMERINEIRYTDYDNRNKDFKIKMFKWFDEYSQFCRIHAAQKRAMPSTNTKQQLLLIYYLQKAQLINLNKIHQDQTKQAGVLSMLFGKGYENVYKDLRKMTTTKYEDEFNKVLYLQPIHELFVLLGIEDIAAEIAERIKEISSKTKK